MKNYRIHLLWLLLAFPFSGALALDNIEFGVGVGSQTLADYRGSERYEVYALPVPYLLFNSRFLKSDKRGFRGEFWSTERYEVNVDFDVSVGGNSEDNELREDMPKLETALELGPSFNMVLSGESFSDGWALRLPVRTVFAVSLHGVKLQSFQHVGFLFNPKVTWSKPNLFMGWQSEFNLGLFYADTNYHDHYYSVYPEYATDDRPLYTASSGYSGTYTHFSLYKKWPKWRLKVSARYDFLGGGEFIDSPLVETKHFGVLNIGLTRTLYFKP